MSRQGRFQNYVPQNLSGSLDNGNQIRRSYSMWWTILVVLVILWLIGFVSNVGGGLIHILLVLAAIIVVVNVVSGRRAV